MFMADEPGGDGWFVVGALLGGAVGMAMGFLSAPRPGAETRQSLTARLESVRAASERGKAPSAPDAGADPSTLEA
jgi:gas vesicle protein